MDDRRFDQLTKAIAGEAGSRREALGLAVGGAATAVLGFLGIDKTVLARRGNKNKNKNGNNHNRNNKKDKKVKICHCPDSSGNNCKTKKYSEKKAKQHLKKHPNDFKGKCDNGCNDYDATCNVNQPGACCAQTCCFDTTSATGGTCPTNGGNCCGSTTTGGYCTTSFPQCCGELACCRNGETCCANVRLTTGYCCPPGYICDFNQFNGCAAPQTAAAASTAETRTETVVGTFEPRGRARN